MRSDSILDSPPRYQESERRRKQVDEQNARAKEWNDSLGADLNKWAAKAKSTGPGRWAEDTPIGNDDDSSKYSVDYSRFEKIEEEEEEAGAGDSQKRDW